MDWFNVAAQLADAVDRPLFVLDDKGEIKLVNRACAALLGDARPSIGQTFFDLVDADHEAAARSLHAEALRGSTAVADVALGARDGVRRVLRVEVLPVTHEGDPWVLCQVGASRVEPVRPAWPDSWLEIRTDDRFGYVIGAHGPDAEAAVGRRCHEVVAGLADRCPDCPLPELASDQLVYDVQVLPDQRLAIRRVVRTSCSRAMVSHDVLAPDMVSRLIGARIDIVSAQHGLSTREREVLARLLGGQSLDEIAGELGIQPRTVRFHQGNVLAKLGIESRVELMRVLME